MKQIIKEIEKDLNCTIELIREYENIFGYELSFDDNQIYFEVEQMKNGLYDFAFHYKDVEQLEENNKIKDLKGMLKDIIWNWEC